MSVQQHVLVFEYGTWDEPDLNNEKFYMYGKVYFLILSAVKVRPEYIKNIFPIEIDCGLTLLIPLKRIKPTVIRAEDMTKTDEKMARSPIFGKKSSFESKSNENHDDEKSLPLCRRILIKGKGNHNRS